MADAKRPIQVVADQKIKLNPALTPMFTLAGLDVAESVGESRRESLFPRE